MPDEIKVWRCRCGKEYHVENTAKLCEVFHDPEKTKKICEKLINKTVKVKKERPGKKRTLFAKIAEFEIIMSDKDKIGIRLKLNLSMNYTGIGEDYAIVIGNEFYGKDYAISHFDDFLERCAYLFLGRHLVHNYSIRRLTANEIQQRIDDLNGEIELFRKELEELAAVDAQKS